MKFLRAGIFVIVAFSVVAHGAVEEWARAVLETGAGILLVASAVRHYFKREEKIVFSPLLPPLAALSVLVFGQWFFRVTASPYNTRIELLLLFADLILLFLAVQAFRTLEDWRGFVWVGMSLGFIVSVFGILQHLTFNGKLYWFREMRYGGIPFGPYVNRNHFAGFAELILPLALVPLVLGRVRRERWPIVGLFAVLPIGALFLSASRGGIISFGAELVVLALVVVLRRTKGKQLLAAGGILLAALLLVSWLGVGQILQRFSSLQSLEVSEGKRASMRRDTWRIFLDHPLVGTGLGTLQIVYPPHETVYDGKIVNHTHNDYLEVLAETGLLGGLCCAWFIGVLLIEALKRSRDLNNSFAGALQLSGLVACSGILVHSLVDFNLHIPSNTLLFFLMAHLATAEMQNSATRPPSSGRRHRTPRNH
ncbi:MAG TPA: O-antigen ligase family protein [Candidatus Acidoferrum sp.]|nr:O-antigen ligase family protein [Candidatus Acidoferrum sp.]